MQETQVRFLGQEYPLEKGEATHLNILGLPCGSAGKESACNEGDLGLIPGLGRSRGQGNGYPLWCSSLKSSIDCIVHGVTKSQTWLSNFHLHPLQYFWASLVAHLVKNPDACNGNLGLILGLGRSPGEGNSYQFHYSGLENPHGQRSQAGYSPWGPKESDRTEWPSTAQHKNPCIHIFSVPDKSSCFNAS